MVTPSSQRETGGFRPHRCSDGRGPWMPPWRNAPVGQTSGCCGLWRLVNDSSPNVPSRGVLLDAMSWWEQLNPGFGAAMGWFHLRLALPGWSTAAQGQEPRSRQQDTLIMLWAEQLESHTQIQRSASAWTSVKLNSYLTLFQPQSCWGFTASCWNPTAGFLESCNMNLGSVCFLDLPVNAEKH